MAALPFLLAAAQAIPSIMQAFSGNNGGGWNGTPSRQTGFINNLDPRGQQLFNQQRERVANYDLASQPGYKQAQQALNQSPYGQPFDPTQANQNFQQGVANPLTQHYNEQIAPQLRQNSYSTGAGGIYGSALDQALNQGAKDLTGTLGSLRSNYLQQQQQQHATGQLDWVMKKLGLETAPMNQQADLFNNLFSQRNVDPMVEQPQSGFGGQFNEFLGILGPLLGDMFKGGQNQTGQNNNFNPHDSLKDMSIKPYGDMSPQGLRKFSSQY